jgi:hypothetical protein
MSTLVELEIIDSIHVPQKIWRILLEVYVTPSAKERKNRAATQLQFNAS